MEQTDYQYERKNFIILHFNKFTNARKKLFLSRRQFLQLSALLLVSVLKPLLLLTGITYGKINRRKIFFNIFLFHLIINVSFSFLCRRRFTRFSALLRLRSASYSADDATGNTSSLAGTGRRAYRHRTAAVRPC